MRTSFGDTIEKLNYFFKKQLPALATCRTLKILLFVSLFLISVWNPHTANAEATVPECLQPSQKQSTIDKFIAVKRSLGCRFSLDPKVCSVSLGIGASAAVIMGASAASRIRSPNFHWCSKNFSSHIILEWLSGTNAWATTTPGCKDVDEVIKQKAKDSLKKAQLDLQNEIERLRSVKNKVAVQKLIEEKKALAALMSKLYDNHFLTDKELYSILDNIYLHGATSTEHLRLLQDLQQYEKTREFRIINSTIVHHSAGSELSKLNNHRLTQRLREIFSGQKPISIASARMGLAGVALSLVSATANATAADRGQGLSAAMTDLTMGGLGVSSVGCSDFNAYYAMENRNNHCQPNYSLDNGKSDAFFQLSTEEMLEKIKQDSNLCRLVQTAYTEAYPTHKKVNCGNPTLIDLGEGNHISIPTAVKNPPDIFHWKDNANTYQMSNDENGQLILMKIINGPFTTTANVNSVEAQQTRVQFQKKYMADVSETLACCTSTGPRPTDEECAQKGVRTTLPGNAPYAPGFRPNMTIESTN